MIMIEVEQKFFYTDEQRARLIEGADFVGEKEMRDVYYDTDDLSLSKKDTWLRRRGRRFEIKTPLHDNFGDAIQQYDEIEDEPGLRKFLGFKKKEPLEKSLTARGYKPIAEYYTVRSTYRKGDFIIDFDDSDYGESKYQILEIELQVENIEEMAAAADRIRSFGQEYGFSGVAIRGKLIEYFKRLRPDIYHTLKEAGVVKVI